MILPDWGRELFFTLGRTSIRLRVRFGPFKSDIKHVSVFAALFRVQFEYLVASPV